MSEEPHGTGSHNGPPAKSAAPYAELLGRTSLFSTLGEDALTTLVGRLSERSYARGETVWNAGDEGDELIIVMTGQLDVWGRGADGSDELIGQIGPAECAGEMALVLDERRSATITCRRAARVLALQKPDFGEIVRSDADLLLRLTELLSRRAVSLAQHRPVVRTTTVVGVAAESGVKGASLVARALADLAGDILGCDAVLVRIRSESSTSLGSLSSGIEQASSLRPRRGLPAVLEVEVPRVATTGELPTAVDGLLIALGERFRLVVIDLPSLGTGAIDLARDACDHVVHVTDRWVPTAGTLGVLSVLNLHGGRATSPPLNHCEPFVLPDEPALAIARARGESLAQVDPRLPASRVLRRLTRKLMGATVGVALGGGAAFGIAHVGVFLALEEAGIPVDLVAGTSMGSIIAIGYAAGLTPEEMEAISRRIGNVRTTLSILDPSVTGTGLLDGRRLMSIFGPLTPQNDFSELAVPCRVVAMDIETGARVDIGSGRLDTASRASCSIPVVFTPVRWEDHVLVDGGFIDPVPGDVVREMGADIVVAVNVVPHLERGVTTAISRTFRRVSRLNPFTYLSGSRDIPDVVDVFMNTLQATEHELGNYKSLAADVLVNVDLAEFTWIDFHRALEIIDRGRLAGERVAPEVRQAMDRILRPAAVSVS